MIKGPGFGGCHAKWMALLGLLLTNVGEASVEYLKDIKPLFSARCTSCHGALKQNAKLRLDTVEFMLRGGKSGPALEPGKPESSLFFKRVTEANPDERMPPPHEGHPLTVAEAALLRQWITGGASAPADEKPEANPAEHWSFRPRTRPSVPKVARSAWVRNPIDAFLSEQHEATGLAPQPEASREILLRRLYLDLVGVPPTVDEITAFEADVATGWYERAVRRLLGDPRHGERWARHWMDIWRYSDWWGLGEELRNSQKHIWHWRDWIVESLNADTPYDQMVRQMLAADELYPKDLQKLRATGFLARNWILFSRLQWMDETVEHVSKGFLGLTMNCAKCHDHKYDPIPTQDYYSLYGIFHNSVEHLISLDPAPAKTEIYAAFEKEYQTKWKAFAAAQSLRREESAARARSRAGEYMAAQLNLSQFPEEGFDQILTTKDLIPAFVRRWRDFLAGRAREHDPVFGLWHHLRTVSPADIERATAAYWSESSRAAKRTNARIRAAFATAPRSMAEAAQRYGAVFVEVDAQWKAALSASRPQGAASLAALADFDAEEIRRILYAPDSPCVVPATGMANNEQFFETDVIEALWKLQGEADRVLLRAAGAPPHALVLRDGPPEPLPRVLIRGKASTLGDEVNRQFLSALAGPNPKPFLQGSGRLELARAIAHADNPLTARVAVNRIWRHHFGAGLVRTPSDLGTRAEPPSHPELLDWLAGWFVTQGWSQKKLHRLIVLSAAYQQSGMEHAKARAVDPENRLLSHFPRQRLDYEALRDSILFTSGELDLQMGGRPVTLHTEPFTARRAVYGLVDRQFVPELLRVFDFANPDMHCPQRSSTMVPQQSLFLLNSPFVAARARALAAKVARENPDGGASSRAARVRSLYRALYLREPTASQLAAGVEFLAVQEPGPAAPARVVPVEWQYGYGEYNATSQRVVQFKPLPHFTGDAWQGSGTYPDAKYGWLKLTADAGHPGNDRAHAVVRRWVAPVDAAVSIAGVVAHSAAPGDGIRAFIVSSRHGVLLTRSLHNSQAAADLARVEVTRGDTLDFVVDIGGTLSHDDFQWAPKIQTLPTAPARLWDALADFGGPPTQPLQMLNPLEAYVHVLLLSNEFAFVE